MLSERRDLQAARAFFRSAKAVTGVVPDRVTTDGHDADPAAIRSELGTTVRHRTSAYLNHRLAQDHRGLKGRYRPMRGFGSVTSARRSVAVTTSCGRVCEPGLAAGSMFRRIAGGSSIFAAPSPSSPSWPQDSAPALPGGSSVTLWRER